MVIAYKASNMYSNTTLWVALGKSLVMMLLTPHANHKGKHHCLDVLFSLTVSIAIGLTYDASLLMNLSGVESREKLSLNAVPHT